MKLHVVHDENGRILAAIKIGTENNILKVRPVAGVGEKSVEVEVSEEHYNKGWAFIYQNLRVDSKSNRLVSVKKANKL